MRLEHVTLLCFFASYLAALALEIGQLVRQGTGKRWAAILFIGAGLVAQTVYLLNRSRDSQLPPLLSSAHDWLLVLSWLAVALLFAVLLWNRHLGVGLFALPPVLIMVGAARFANQSPSVQPLNLYWLELLHASLWVLGIAGVTVSFVLSLMYLVQHRRLKLKRIEPGELQLFSLERLGRWNWWGVILCVPLLTLAMMTGIGLVVWSPDTERRLSLMQSGFLMTSILWLGMAVLFGWLLTARHPGGKNVAWRTVWACGLLLVMLLAQQLFSRGGIHGPRTNDTEASRRVLDGREARPA